MLIHEFCSRRDGGASRDRTDDPLLAKQVLSQLSYGPLLVFFEPAVVACLTQSVIYARKLLPSLVKRLARLEKSCAIPKLMLPGT